MPLSKKYSFLIFTFLWNQAFSNVPEGQPASIRISLTTIFYFFCSHRLLFTIFWFFDIFRYIIITARLSANFVDNFVAHRKKLTGLILEDFHKIIIANKKSPLKIFFWENLLREIPTDRPNHQPDPTRLSKSSFRKVRADPTSNIGGRCRP